MKWHPPRPWHCTSPTAAYCPHHGDCTCADRRFAASCPLHREGTSHPYAEPRLVA